MNPLGLSPREQEIAEFGAMNGKSIDEVKLAVAKYRKEQQLNTPIQPAEKRTATDKVRDFAGGAVYGFSSPGRNIQNMLSKGVDKVFGTKDFGKATKEDFEGSLNVDVDTTSGKVGQFAGEIVPYVAQPGALGVKGALGFGGRAALNTAIGTAQTGDLKKGVAIGLGGEVLSKVGGVGLQQLGRGLYKLAVPLSKGEAKMVQSYKAGNSLSKRFGDFLKGKSSAPRTAEETAFNKGLTGTQSMVGIQAKRANQEIWTDVVSPALKNVDAQVNMGEFFSRAEQQIIKGNADLTRRKSLLKALDAIKKDYAEVDNISAEELQKLKQGWTEFLPAKTFKGEDVSGAATQVRNELSRQARNDIHTLIDDPSVKQAYIDYGNMIGLQEWGQTAMTGAKFKGGSGGLVNALKDVVVIPVATIGGRTVYRTGKGIEFIGPAGAKTLDDIINGDDSSFSQ